jgi:hypothetical protein
VYYWLLACPRAAPDPAVAAAVEVVEAMSTYNRAVRAEDHAQVAETFLADGELRGAEGVFRGPDAILTHLLATRLRPLVAWEVTVDTVTCAEQARSCTLRGTWLREVTEGGPEEGAYEAVWGRRADGRWGLAVLETNP